MAFIKVIIDATDVQHLMGVNERTAQRYLRSIRRHFGKEISHFVTVDEFSEFTGIPIEMIHEYFKENR